MDLSLSEIIFGLFAVIMAVLFFIICINISKIKFYLDSLYVFEKTRMIEEGLIDPKTNKIIKWRFNERNEAIPRNINE